MEAQPSNLVGTTGYHGPLTESEELRNLLQTGEHYPYENKKPRQKPRQRILIRSITDHKKLKIS